MVDVRRHRLRRVRPPSNPAKDATIPNRRRPAPSSWPTSSTSSAATARRPRRPALLGPLLVGQPLHDLIPGIDEEGIFLAIYANAATFLVSAWIVWGLTFRPGGPVTNQGRVRSCGASRTACSSSRSAPSCAGSSPACSAPSPGRARHRPRHALRRGHGGRRTRLRHALRQRLQRHGARPHPRSTSAPRILSPKAFRRSLTGAGIVLLVLALVPTFLLSLPLALVLGAFVGVGWVVGYTLIGLTVEDDPRAHLRPRPVTRRCRPRHRARRCPARRGDVRRAPRDWSPSTSVSSS